jgi:hypothetical protein
MYHSVPVRHMYVLFCMYLSVPVRDIKHYKNFLSLIYSDQN